jgi:hypothetical protein
MPSKLCTCTASGCIYETSRHPITSREIQGCYLNPSQWNAHKVYQMQVDHDRLQTEVADSTIVRTITATKDQAASLTALTRELLNPDTLVSRNFPNSTTGLSRGFSSSPSGQTNISMLQKDSVAKDLAHCESSLDRMVASFVSPDSLSFESAPLPDTPYMTFFDNKEVSQCLK